MKCLRLTGFGALLKRKTLCGKSDFYPNVEHMVYPVGGVRGALMHTG